MQSPHLRQVLFNPFPIIFFFLGRMQRVKQTLPTSDCMLSGASRISACIKASCCGSAITAVCTRLDARPPYHSVGFGNRPGRNMHRLDDLRSNQSLIRKCGVKRQSRSARDFILPPSVYSRINGHATSCRRESRVWKNQSLGRH